MQGTLAVCTTWCSVDLQGMMCLIQVITTLRNTHFVMYRDGLHDIYRAKLLYQVVK